jgi:hypothetical protein
MTVAGVAATTTGATEAAGVIEAGVIEAGVIEAIGAIIAAWWTEAAFAGVDSAVGAALSVVVSTAVAAVSTVEEGSTVVEAFTVAGTVEPGSWQKSNRLPMWQPFALVMWPEF